MGVGHARHIRLGFAQLHGLLRPEERSRGGQGPGQPTFNNVFHLHPSRRILWVCHKQLCLRGSGLASAAQCAMEDQQTRAGGAPQSSREANAVVV